MTTLVPICAMVKAGAMSGQTQYLARLDLVGVRQLILVQFKDPAGEQHGDMNRGTEPIEVVVVQQRR